MHSLYEFCYKTYIYIQQTCHSVLVKVHPIISYRTVFLGSARFLGWTPLFVFFGLPIVSCSLMNSLILGCLWLSVIVIKYFDTRHLVFCNLSPPRMFLPLDLLSEYRIQYGAIGPLYVTSSYSTWIFCRGVSGFAADCHCSVWCFGLTTCLLCVGPPFWKSTFKQQLGCRFDIMDSIFSFHLFFDIYNYMSWYIISFFGFFFTW